MDYRLDTEIFSKVDALLDKIKKNRELQQMALDNGIDIKNSVLLTDETENNYAIAAIALMLAKRADDSRYKDLVRYGMDHRTTKMDIINDYKDQANQMLEKYKNRNKVTVSITSYEESYYNDLESDSDDISAITEMTEAYLKQVDLYQEVSIADAIVWVLLLPYKILMYLIIGFMNIIGKFLDFIDNIKNKNKIKKIKKLLNDYSKDKQGDIIIHTTDNEYVWVFTAHDKLMDLIEKFKDLASDEESIVRRTSEWNELSKLTNNMMIGRDGPYFDRYKEFKYSELEKLVNSYESFVEIIPELRKSLSDFKVILQSHKEKLQELEKEYKRDPYDPTKKESPTNQRGIQNTADIKQRSESVEKIGKDLLQLVESVTSSTERSIREIFSDKNIDKLRS